MKHETYEQFEKRLAIRSWSLISIAMIMPWLPIAVIYFYG